MSVDDLRQQLRDRGYLTHGIERWFALDPWSSRTFWRELAMLAVKAAVLLGAFGALHPTAVMLIRNAPLGAAETLALFVSYAVTGAATACAVIVAAALLLKLRPALPIDTPGALLAISFGASALLTAPLLYWWWRFDTPPSVPELAAGGALATVFFLAGSVVVSAALLSFSIYEVQRIPAIHQKSRTVPMSVAGAVLVALLFLPGWARQDRGPAQPMVVVSPNDRMVALIAVDGLTWDILRSRSDLMRSLPHAAAVRTPGGESTTERWASLGTGVRTDAHRVRAIEGVRFRGGEHVLQRISAADFVLRHVVPAAGAARREPLPPSVRRREYVWEIVAERGVRALSVNWWTTADARSGGLVSVGQESIFASAAGDPLRVDALAAGRFRQSLDREKPRLATVYLPALDVVLNRVEADEATRLARSIRVLDAVAATVAAALERGYDVIVVGLPGDRQRGSAIVASSIPLASPSSAWDVAPTVLDLLGFPLSAEMPGRSLVAGPPQQRIASYGERAVTGPAPALNREYYETLRSLGYVR